MTPEDVEALFQKQLSSEGDAAIQERTELLRGVLRTLEEKGASGESNSELYVEKLANGSRDASWRTSLGESGILGFVVGAVKNPESPKPLKIHSLRLIGNSVADTDANRDRVVQAEGIPALLGLLPEPDLLPYVVAVLYNLMLDYAPAQLQASNSKLSARLVDIISNPDVSAFQGQLGLICKLLNLLISQEPEPTNANPETPLALLKLTQNPSLDEDPSAILPLVSASTEYLSHASLQTHFITSGGVPTFLSVFETLQGRSYDPENLAGSDDDAELANQVTVLRKVLVNAIADITDNPAFKAEHPLGSGVFEKIKGWLDFRSGELQAAACLSLGNLSRSDEATLALVNDHSIHDPVIAALSGTEDTLLTHSALSFLRNLSIPPQNRTVLGPLLLKPEVLPRIWGLETLPQVQLASASLARLLAVGSPENVRILTTADGDGKTGVQRVIELFERADDPAKMEAARAVMAVLRTLASTDCGVDVEEFYARHSPVKALAHLLTQQRFPPLRSETLFVLGLMVTRSSPSVDTVLSLTRIPEVEDVFRGAVKGSLPEAVEENPLAVAEPREPKGEGAEGAARADRENALVVVTKLLGSVEDSSLRGDLEGLLSDGGVKVDDAVGGDREG